MNAADTVLKDYLLEAGKTLEEAEETLSLLQGKDIHVVRVSNFAGRVTFIDEPLASFPAKALARMFIRRFEKHMHLRSEEYLAELTHSTNRAFATSKNGYPTRPLKRDHKTITEKYKFTFAGKVCTPLAFKDAEYDIITVPLPGKGFKL